jgi:hypothetical protein
MRNIPNRSGSTGKKCMVSMALFLSVAGCSPTVKLEAPEKPIEINLNIKIEQEVRVKVDNDLDAAFASDPALFGTKTAPKSAPATAATAAPVAAPATAPVTAPVAPPVIAPITAPKAAPIQSHQFEGNK